MGGQGIGQILVYAAVLLALSYPLGIWMARVYTRERGDVVERAFLRLLGRDAEIDQNWKQYGLSVIVFTIGFSVFSIAVDPVCSITSRSRSFTSLSRQKKPWRSCTHSK